MHPVCCLPGPQRLHFHPSYVRVSDLGVWPRGSVALWLHVFPDHPLVCTSGIKPISGPVFLGSTPVYPDLDLLGHRWVREGRWAQDPHLQTLISRRSCGMHLGKCGVLVLPLHVPT